MMRAGLLAILGLAVPLQAFAAGGGHSEPPPDADPDAEPAAQPIMIAPSYRGIPLDIVVAMQRRILQRRGELEPEEPASESKHGSGH